MTPKYFTLLFSISYVSKSLSPHQFCTKFNALYIKSQMVLRNFPLMRITTSLAKLCTKQVQFPNRFSRLSATIFQSKCDSTPPCRQPRRTLICTLTLLISTKTLGDLSMKVNYYIHNKNLYKGEWGSYGHFFPS
jgi:hypothetical protein